MSDQAITQPLRVPVFECYVTGQPTAFHAQIGEHLFPLSERGREILDAEKSRLYRRLANGELYR